MKPAPRKHPIRSYLVATSALMLMLMAAVVYWAPLYIERMLNRQDFGTVVADATGGTFTSGRLRFHLWPLPHVVVPDGQLSIPDWLSGHWRRAKVYPAYAALVTGDIRVGAIIVEKPTFFAQARPIAALRPPTSPMSNIDGSGLKQNFQKWLQQAAQLAAETRIEIHQGRFKITDLVQPSLQLDAIDLDLRWSRQKLVIDLRSRSNFWDDMHLAGTLQPVPTEGHFQIELRKFDPSPLMPPVLLETFRWQNTPMNLQVKADLADEAHATARLKAQIPALRLEGAKGDVTAKGLEMEATLDYSPRSIRIDEAALKAREPSLRLFGHGVFDRRTPLYEIQLTGRELAVEPLRSAALTLAGGNEIVDGIFDVLRDGRVPWIRYVARGATAQEMTLFNNMTIDGLLEQGRLFIPEADLDLTDVSGKAEIAKGVLEGSDLAAAFGNSRGSDGRLWLDLGQEHTLPFYLEIDVEADLAPLPALLATWVADPVFKGEMQRIENVAGSATGTLLLDGRGTGLDVTVDATRCRFNADYDRLPARLSVRQGAVQYTGDRIQVIGLQGRIETNQLDALSAQITFGETPLLKINRGAAHLDLSMIAPWVANFGTYEALPFRLPPSNGWIKVDHLALEGPLLQPSQWRIETHGLAKDAAIEAPRLPAPVHIASGRFTVLPGSLTVPEARLKMADADLAIENLHIELAQWSLAAATATVSGAIGKTAGNWFADQIDLGQPWRLKPPVTVTAAQLAWSAGGAQAFRGAMTTGGGTLLTLDLSVQDNRLRHQSVIVEDQDSHAELNVVLEPESLKVDFTGRFASATISRMMQEEYQHSGYMEGQFRAHIFPQHPGRSSVNGTLQAHDLHQPLAIPQQHQIKKLFLEARDNRLRIQPAIVDIEGQTHHLAGSLDIENDGFLLDLVHEAKEITLSLPESPSSDPAASKESAFSLWDLPLKGRIISRIGALTLGPFRWSPLNATTRLDRNDGHCRIEDASLCGIATRGDIHFGPQTLSIALSPAIKEAAFDKTMTCLLKKPKLIDGRFDLEGQLKSQSSYRNVVRHMDGQMALMARNGRIYRFHLLSKVLAVVNVTEVLRGKMPDLMRNGLAYESIAIQLDINKGIAIIKEAVIDGASANLAGEGTIDLTTGETDMIVLVAPFKTVDALVSYTPLLGDWLGGTLISIPVKVTGGFADPNVTPLAPSAVGSSLMNLMKKTIKFPIKIVEPLLNKEDAPGP